MRGGCTVCVLRAALLVALGSGGGCMLSLAQPARQQHRVARQLQHRYVTVEIGGATCDVTQYGAVGDGHTDVSVAVLPQHAVWRAGG